MRAVDGVCCDGMCVGGLLFGEVMVCGGRVSMGCATLQDFGCGMERNCLEDGGHEGQGNEGRHDTTKASTIKAENGEKLP